jgi:hypothetical protein
VWAPVRLLRSRLDIEDVALQSPGLPTDLSTYGLLRGLDGPELQCCHLPGLCCKLGSAMVWAESSLLPSGVQVLIIHARMALVQVQGSAARAFPGGPARTVMFVFAEPAVPKERALDRMSATATLVRRCAGVHLDREDFVYGLDGWEHTARERVPMATGSCDRRKHPRLIKYQTWNPNFSSLRYWQVGLARYVTNASGARAAASARAPAPASATARVGTPARFATHQSAT